MEINSVKNYESEVNMKDTELRLGLPGSEEAEKGSSFRRNKRSLLEEESISKSSDVSNGSDDQHDNTPPAK